METPETIQLLIARNRFSADDYTSYFNIIALFECFILRSVVTPILVRPAKLWSTFWGALSSDGFYQRSDDYSDIVLNKKRCAARVLHHSLKLCECEALCTVLFTCRGLWNVPYVMGAYLVKAEVLPRIVGAYSHATLDPDMAFCSVLRNKVRTTTLPAFRASSVFSATLFL